MTNRDADTVDPDSTDTGGPNAGGADNSGSNRLRPHTPAAWATVILGGTFLVLWAVFAVRAVDRNADPTPAPIIPPPATTTPDLRATVDAANRLLFPDRPSGSPTAKPAATPGAPAASPVASPPATPMPPP